MSAGRERWWSSPVLAVWLAGEAIVRVIKWGRRGVWPWTTWPTACPECAARGGHRTGCPQAQPPAH